MKRVMRFLAALIPTFVLAGPANAIVITLDFSVLATGVDRGPQDGVYDLLIVPSALITDDGTDQYRAIAEFSLSALPDGATINSAVLSGRLSNFSPDSRRVAVLGYDGNGIAELEDFPLSSASVLADVNLGGSSLLDFAHDVTGFIEFLVAGSHAFAGFGWVHAAGGPQFAGVGAPPRLTIDYTPLAVKVPEPGTWMLVLSGLGLVPLLGRIGARKT